MSVIILRPAEAVKESWEPGGQEYLQSIANVKLFRHPCPPLCTGAIFLPPFCKGEWGGFVSGFQRGEKR